MTREQVPSAPGKARPIIVVRLALRTGNPPRIHPRRPWLVVPTTLALLVIPSLMPLRSAAVRAEEPAIKTSYDQVAPVLLGKETFQAVVTKDKADKPAVMARQKELLETRYDLTSRPDSKVKMTRGKPIQVGPTAKLADGMTWDKLAEMAPEEIREKDLFPKGYLPLPHPKHLVGGMVFPQMEIKQLRSPGAFRPRFRPPRALPPRVPAGHLPDHPDRPGRRLPR